MPNIVYIATSLDGYIADKSGGVDWLHSTPNPDNDDCGWAQFIAGIDGLVMGRITFEAVCGFDVEWPYSVPVFVLSNSMSSIPEGYRDKAEVVRGALPDVVKSLNEKGLNNLYIDGGKTIQSFLQADLIDEMIITQIPILLGGGFPLFGELAHPIAFEHVGTKVHLNALVQSHYRRKL
ncbi:dihydrofolate reductase family protein [Microbulbifer sp. TYP-18]|uniref:dihydrofolate reductase family protein n=1 Tax=Microbulbifer sp. TYP-18 TaxID=3230024 RepID=UPI0034C5BF44